MKPTAIPMLVLCLAWTAGVSASHGPAHLAMPPAFTMQADPQAVLGAYPLTEITKQAAFSHHGKARRSVTLPNGKEGWVYEVGTVQARTYQNPRGEPRSVQEAETGHGLRSYTLVFDARGVVSDVLYREQGPHDGLTALQVQLRAGGNVPAGKGGHDMK